MKLYYLLFLAWMCCSTLGSCSKDDTEILFDKPLPDTICLDVKICPSAEGTRAHMGDVAYEEGEVRELIYAIFKDGKRVKGPVLLTDLRKEDNTFYHTGDTYKITDLETEWFVGGKTEVFVVANPNIVEKSFLTNTNNGLDAWKKSCFYWKDLNKEAMDNPDYAILPTMSGYLVIEKEASSVVTISVEHIYSRIWFTFGWKGQPESDEIFIDEVRVEHLMYRTLTFNSSFLPGEYNPGISDNMWQSFSVKEEGTEHPFMACPEPVDGKFHLGDTPQMRLTKDTRKQYNVLSRYPRKADGQPDFTKIPLRYYIYCYQWEGLRLQDNPFITINYHFVKNGETVHKRASAWLYDPNYNPGKRHHGILRNYTYQVYCYINTTMNKLDLQVTARPWIEHIIDDIPAFE